MGTQNASRQHACMKSMCRPNWERIFQRGAARNFCGNTAVGGATAVLDTASNRPVIAPFNRSSP